MTSHAILPVHIRPFLATDSATLVALFRDSVRSTSPRDYAEMQVRAWAPEVIDLEQFKARCEAKTTWVAEGQGRVVGFCDLEPDGHIDMLYVHPQHQRRSVGGTMLDYLENVARQRQLARLYAESSISALPVFEAHGFHCMAPQTVTVRGVSMTNFRMEKYLNSR